MTTKATIYFFATILVAGLASVGGFAAANSRALPMGTPAFNGPELIQTSMPEASASVAPTSVLDQNQILKAPWLANIKARTPDLRGGVEISLLSTSNSPGDARIVHILMWSRLEDEAIGIKTIVHLFSLNDPANLLTPIVTNISTFEHEYEVKIQAKKSWLDVSDVREISVAFVDKKTTK
ncbi:MAG: hypothetical protein ACKVS6_06875 [Planctomycetota bacterium]